MPDVELEFISFNHNTDSHTEDALNIRRNYFQEVAVPEWVRGMADFEDSKAAYAILPIKGNVVTVKASFSIASEEMNDAEVKADVAGVENSNILGNLDQKSLANDGISDPDNPGFILVSFELNHHQINKIGRYDLEWAWYFRLPGQPEWQDICTSRHGIYVILDTPNAPWNQEPSDNRNPWTEVLDISCVKASGKNEKESATRRITKSIYSDFDMIYDVGEDDGDGGEAAYVDYETWPDEIFTFQFRDWLNLSNGTTINCYDTGCALTVLANVLGCGLVQQLHEDFGYLNMVIPIGRDVCNNPFYGSDTPGRLPDPVVGEDILHPARSYFGRHSYAKLNGKVYDATMKVHTEITTMVIVAIIIVWYILLIFTFGTIGVEWLIEKLAQAEGWLINLSQESYNGKTIDTSTEAEAAEAGGAPENWETVII